MSQFKIKRGNKMDNVKNNKKSRLIEATALIETSKELVAKADSEMEKCKTEISKAAANFDEVKSSFKNVTFKKTEALLEKLGFDYLSQEEADAFELSIADSNAKDFTIKNISSGRFTGFILALIFALLTVAGWIYFAAQKLNLNFDMKNLDVAKATQSVEPMLKWVATDAVPGAGGSMMFGAIIVGLSALIVGWIVYALRTSLKSSKNLRVAQTTLEQSTDYCMSQEECQREMKEVDAHLWEATAEVKNLETILNEQTSVLERIIHVEGIVDEEKEYHPSSKKVMRETEKIMRATENLLDTPITIDKKLNPESVQSLNIAKDVYAEYLSRIYG